MPFKKIGPNRYRSPSGRTYTLDQVRLYHARGGTFKAPAKRADRSRSSSAPKRAKR